MTPHTWTDWFLTAVGLWLVVDGWTDGPIARRIARTFTDPR